MDHQNNYSHQHKWQNIDCYILIHRNKLVHNSMDRNMVKYLDNTMKYHHLHHLKMKLLDQLNMIQQHRLVVMLAKVHLIDHNMMVDHYQYHNKIVHLDKNHLGFQYIHHQLGLFIYCDEWVLFIFKHMKITYNYSMELGLH